MPVTVAVLGSKTVDVTKIDLTTLRLGPNGAAPVSTQIVSAKNGRVDLLASFRVQDTGLAVGDTQACLLGTIGDEFFRGCDRVVVSLFAGTEGWRRGRDGSLVEGRLVDFRLPEGQANNEARRP
jgi:hypothetical protein